MYLLKDWEKIDFLNFYKCINFKVKFEILFFFLELRCILLEVCILVCIENIVLKFESRLF